MPTPPGRSNSQAPKGWKFHKSISESWSTGSVGSSKTWPRPLKNNLKARRPRQTTGCNHPRNRSWAGLQLEIPQGRGKKAWAELLATIGDSKPVFLHHKPTGKLVLASGKSFAAKLFVEKPNLANDPIYKQTMDGLPKEGISLGYISPELFKMIRGTIVQLTSNEQMRSREMFMVNTMLDLLFPEGLRGEGSVTTTTKEGILTVSNSSNSHKGKLAGS